MKTLLALDIDGVVRDVAGSYLRALADTVEHYAGFRPSLDQIDRLKTEGIWNNDWEAARELIYRHFEAQELTRSNVPLSYPQLVAFFQERYLGEDFGGYIRAEPLLIGREFFEPWDRAGINWGFVSGASRASAEFVLGRLGLERPPLVAMGEAPEKPDPGGLLKLVAQYPETSQVVYCGDTAADILTVVHAQQADPTRVYRAVGVLPPHNRSTAYQEQLLERGAHRVIRGLAELTVADVRGLF